MKDMLSTTVHRPDEGLKGGQGCVVGRHRNDGIGSDSIVIVIPSICCCMLSLFVLEEVDV